MRNENSFKKNKNIKVCIFALSKQGGGTLIISAIKESLVNQRESGVFLTRV